MEQNSIEGKFIFLRTINIMRARVSSAVTDISLLLTELYAYQSIHETVLNTTSMLCILRSFNHRRIHRQYGTFYTNGKKIEENIQSFKIQNLFHRKIFKQLL